MLQQVLKATSRILALKYIKKNLSKRRIVTPFKIFFYELTSLSYTNIKLEKTRRITYEKYFVVVY
jgi:hypothetical protein